MRKLAFVTYLLGLLLFVISGFLPCITWGWLDGNYTENGLTAAIMSLQLFAMFPFHALSNIFVVVSPLVFIQVSHGKFPQAWIPFIILTVAIWISIIMQAFKLHIGYFTWTASISLITFSLWIMTRKTKS